MSNRLSRFAIAVCGIVGVITLLTSFFINPSPRPGSTIAEVLEFGRQHQTGIIVGGWLQGVGTFLNVVFFLALVHLAGATHRLAGWLTIVASGTILAVSLLEITFYLAAVGSGVSDDTTALSTVLILLKAVQHVFLVAPAIYLPLGAVVLSSRVLPRLFGYSALALGATLQVLGLVGLFDALQDVIDIMLIFQEVWLISAAVTLIIMTLKKPAPAPASPPQLTSLGA